MKLKKTLLYGFSILSLTCLSSAQDAPKGPPPEGGPPGGPPPGGGDSGARAAEFIKRMDTDGDGKVNKEEFAVLSRKMSDERFGQMDANGDGLIDHEEIGRMAQRGGGQGGPGMRRPEGGSPGGEGGGFRRPPGGGEGGSPGSPGGQPQGQGMRREGEGGREGGRGRGMFGDPKENFKRMDADGNGSVSEEEYLKAMEKMREMFRGGQGQGGAGMNRPEGGGAGGPPGEGQGGFRRPPAEGDAPKAPEAPAPDKPKE